MVEGRCLLYVAIAALVSAPVQAAPVLSLPIACEIGAACIVQNYVDRDPGPAARDYHCGFLTYDGHKGTDIRVIDRARYKEGVAVVAQTLQREIVLKAERKERGQSCRKQRKRHNALPRNARPGGRIRLRRCVHLSIQSMG